MRSAVIVAGVVVGWLAAPALAQQPPVLTLTLAEAQARAVDSSHRLAEGRARESVARAAVDARGALDRPQVTATAGYTRTNHVVPFSFPGPGGVPRVVYPDVPDNYGARLDLQWPIYSGGRADALERAARADAAAATSELAAARADLRLEVARAFWAVVTSRAALAVLQRSVSRAESHAADVRERFAAGLVAPNETASSEAQLSRARMGLIEATNQRDAATAELARLIGADLGTNIEPSASLDAVTVESPAVAALVAQAQAGRADRAALGQRLDAAQAQRDAAAAAKRPTLAVTGGVDYARPNPKIFPRAERWDDSWDAGIRVSWPLWDGGRADAEIAQAAGSAAAARARLAEFDSQLSLDVRVRTLDIASGRAAVEAAAAAIRAAGEAYRVVSERYRAGVIPQGDVLDAELALVQAELDRTRALAGVRLAEARLSRALGQ